MELWEGVSHTQVEPKGCPLFLAPQPHPGPGLEEISSHPEPDLPAQAKVSRNYREG